jgi:hypothetical protein
MARGIDWNERGNKLERAGRLAEAEAAYEKALRLTPRRPSAWYNLGLLYKRTRRWGDSLRCNLRAAELEPSNEAAWWNLGIAATALGDWKQARRAWSRFGVPIPEGEGPIELHLGAVPIRLNPDARAEVVWCQRIDPARAVISNVPLPESGHRYHDLVLHDGAPTGYREVDGRKVPVFDALALLQASTHATFRVAVEAPAEGDIDALQEALTDADMAGEDWTASVRHVCEACSHGTPHEHAPVTPGVWLRSRDLGVAAESEAEAEGALAKWAAAGKGRAVGRLARVVEAGSRN